MLRKREGVRRTRLSSTLCVPLRPSAGWLQGSPYRRFLLPPAFRFAGAEVLPESGLETLPSLEGFAGMVFVLVTDGVGISAFQNRCHRLPPSDRRKPVVEALLVHPDAGTNAQHPEILRGVAQVVRRTGRNRQKLGNLLHPVNERFVLGCFGLVRRVNGRKFAWNRMLLTLSL